MAARRKVRAPQAQLAFDALSIEGGVLSPDWLSRVAQLAAPQQDASDYRIPKGLTLRDEIGRYWRIAQAHWAELVAGRAGHADPAALAARFVPALLREAFGFGSLAEVPPVVMAERSYPIGHAALGGRVPVVVAPVGSGLDALSGAFGDGTRKRSAFGLLQEHLNATESAMWGLACDGLTLRIVRDNASLTRPAWIEADLALIFEGQRYADFTALWLVAHETRFGKPGELASACALEAWRTAGREEGTRAREHLRLGVEDALTALGTGFLAHDDNKALRDALKDGSLTKRAYFNQLLRLVYRLIFLLTVEERGLLHPVDASPEAAEARALYEEGYSLKRLRERSVRRSAHDRFSDLWEAAKIVFRGLAEAEPALALPALGGLFAANQCAALDAGKLENRALLAAVFRLSWLREGSGLSRVNWRDMGPEELGSVYESLLELEPLITDDRRGFSFATGDEAKGHARKTTGSYYTPDSLVQVLLDSALEPVVAETVAKSPENPAGALLDLAIVDPACGSGHFLLAAARRLAGHVARLECAGTPSAEEYRHALRRVVGRCVYGVDLNPMAVELCKVALWMEAVEPGLPLGFLDSHVQMGNALLGATPELLQKGIPDAAWEPIEGDDKKIASALKKHNKADAKALGLDFRKSPESTYARLGAGARAVDEAKDGTLEDVVAKADQWLALVRSAAYDHQRFVADLWCAAFVWRKEAGRLREIAPTDATFRAIQADAAKATEELRAEVTRLRKQYRFFHWHLAFPQVFARGGFDVVLGNPPWEHVEIKEEEWFATRVPEIAAAPNAAARKRMIAALADTAPALSDEFHDALRAAHGENHLTRASGRFPRCAHGRINTYALFAEHNRAVLGPAGRAGFIVPTGIATDDNTKEYFAALVENAELTRLLSFENEDRVFPAVHHATKFALVVLDRAGRSPRSDLVFFARSAGELAEPGRHFSLAAPDFLTLNPNTLTCPTFRSRRDADLNLAIYRRVPVLWREEDEHGNPWALRFMQGIFNMASDSALFRDADALDADGWRRRENWFERAGARMAPLLEAKMVHMFDHRFGTYEGQTEAQANQGKLPEFDDTAHADPGGRTLPYYWVPESELSACLRGRWARGWLLGWRDICRSTDQRTVTPSLIPRVAVGHKFPLMLPAVEANSIGALYANLCSFALDYAGRQKLGGTSLTYFVLKQLPVLAPSAYEPPAPWSRSTSLRDWLLPRVLELTYTAWDLESFARDVGWDGPPFRWDPARRFLLRCELDAAFFHLYGLSRDDTDYVMDTFPIVRKNDEKAHGEYRTKRVILEIYDAMAEAARTGRAYETRLDPAPADPRVAHEDTRRGQG